MSASPFTVSTAYAPRTVLPGSLVQGEGWTLKSYHVFLNADDAEVAMDPAVVRLALAALPRPAATERRPGVGWLILHRGAGATYAVLGWWERENENPVRVWVRGDGDAWREGQDESFCVWDLQVICHERDAYVRHVLRDAAGDVAAYLTDVYPPSP